MLQRGKRAAIDSEGARGYVVNYRLEKLWAFCACHACYTPYMDRSTGPRRSRCPASYMPECHTLPQDEAIHPCKCFPRVLHWRLRPWQNVDQPMTLCRLCACTELSYQPATPTRLLVPLPDRADFPDLQTKPSSMDGVGLEVRDTTAWFLAQAAPPYTYPHPGS